MLCRFRRNARSCRACLVLPRLNISGKQGNPLRLAQGGGGCSTVLHPAVERAVEHFGSRYRPTVLFVCQLLAIPHVVTHIDCGMSAARQMLNNPSNSGLGGLLGRLMLQAFPGRLRALHSLYCGVARGFGSHHKLPGSPPRPGATLLFTTANFRAIPVVLVRVKVMHAI